MTNLQIFLQNEDNKKEILSLLNKLNNKNNLEFLDLIIENVQWKFIVFYNEHEEDEILMINSKNELFEIIETEFDTKINKIENKLASFSDIENIAIIDKKDYEAYGISENKEDIEELEDEIYENNGKYYHSNIILQNSLFGFPMKNKDSFDIIHNFICGNKPVFTELDKEFKKFVKFYLDNNGDLKFLNIDKKNLFDINFYPKYFKKYKQLKGSQNIMEFFDSLDILFKLLSFSIDKTVSFFREEKEFDAFIARVKEGDLVLKSVELITPKIR